MQKHSTHRRGARACAPLYRSNLSNDHLAGEYHIEPCEALLLVYADEDREPEDGERVYMHYARDGMGCGCISYGVYSREAGGGFSVTHDDDGSNAVNSSGDTYEAHMRHHLMRLVGVIRDDKAAWFDAEDAGKWAGAKTSPLRESDLVMSEEE